MAKLTINTAAPAFYISVVPEMPEIVLTASVTGVAPGQAAPAAPGSAFTWHCSLVTVARLSLAFAAALALPAAGPAPPLTPLPSTVLIGLDSLSLWRGGHVVVHRALDGWTLGAARVRGKTIEVAADRIDAPETTGNFLRFDAATLAPLGHGNDRALALTPARVPIGLDADFPDDAARLPPALAQGRRRHGGA